MHFHFFFFVIGIIVIVFQRSPSEEKNKYEAGIRKGEKAARVKQWKSNTYAQFGPGRAKAIARLQSKVHWWKERLSIRNKKRETLNYDGQRPNINIEE